MKSRTLFLILFSGYVSLSRCVEQTSVVAAHMGYPKKIVNLRNMMDNILREDRIASMNHVQKLRAQNLELRAEQFAALSRDAYFAREKRIDTAFEELSNEFIRESQKLDFEDASLKTKQIFIAKISDQAQQKIDALSKKERGTFAR